MYTNRAVMWTDCYVFWEKTEGSLVPGIIKQIFTVGNQQSCFVAIHKNLPIREDSVDPFALYKDFRVSLWREEFKQEVCIFTLKGSSFCHAIFMPWNAKNLVIKPLNRVSNYPRRCINCLPSIDDLSY